MSVPRGLLTLAEYRVWSRRFGRRPAAMISLAGEPVPEQCMECGCPLPPLPAAWAPRGVFAEGCGGPWRCLPCHEVWEEDMLLIPESGLHTG